MAKARCAGLHVFLQRRPCRVMHIILILLYQILCLLSRPRGLFSQIRHIWWGKTLGLCPKPKTLGLCPKPCKGLLERSPLTARTLTQLDLCLCIYVVQILVQPYSVLLFPAAPSRIPPAKCGRFHSLRYRIEVVGKLHLNGAERPAGSSGSGKDTSYRKCRLIPPHQSLSRQTACSFLSPQGEAFLQESFRATQQGDEREQYRPPSSVAFDAKLQAV